MNAAPFRLTGVPEPPSAGPAAALERLKRVLPTSAARAPSLDRTGAFPDADVQLLFECGALAAFVGEDAAPIDLFEALRLVGRTNLSLGRIFEGHVNGALLVKWYGDAEQRSRLKAALEDGALFGVWSTEPAAGVTLVEDEAGPRLQGSKSYATGAGWVSHAVVTATLPGGERQLVLAKGDDPARADPSTWRVRGMRATGSGGYDLTGLPASKDQRIGGPGDYLREPRFSGGAWRFTAVQLGGLERVLMLLREHLASGDPPDQNRAMQFGRVLADVRSAYFWVREAAIRAEAPEAGPQEAAFVLLTRGVVERAGLQLMEAAARLVGTRAFFEDHPLDQACRDLALYLRQPAPDLALERAARAALRQDVVRDDPLW